MTPRPALAVALSLTAVLALSACSDDDPASSQAAPTATETAGTIPTASTSASTSASASATASPTASTATTGAAATSPAAATPSRTKVVLFGDDLGPPRSATRSARPSPP